LSAETVIETLQIREAVKADAGNIAGLIGEVAHYFLAEPGGQGAEGFLSTVTRPAIEGLIDNPGYVYFVGFMGNRLAGAAAIRDGTHVYHLFVHPEFQRQGIARSLWRTLQTSAAKQGSSTSFTVNSSLFAVPVYASFGFAAEAAPQTKNGICYQPMRLAPAP
jgi:ribosomal protein S18 acetylase RimI-like enzyme